MPASGLSVVVPIPIPILRGAAIHRLHCWTWSLDDGGYTAAVVARMAQSVLSDPERARATAFHRESDRVAYVVAHAGLRWLLGGYLQRDPAGLQFTTQHEGKPVLVAGGPLMFNLSHTRQHAMCAVSSTPVGIDIETIGGAADLDGLLASICAPREHAAMRALSIADRHAAFYRLWVRKEALLKAMGTGLGGSPTSHEVGAAHWGEEWRELGSIGLESAGPGERCDAQRKWLARDIGAPSRHMAAVVVAAAPAAPPECSEFSLPEDWLDRFEPGGVRPAAMTGLFDG